jgi:hypothetical protein
MLMREVPKRWYREVGSMLGFEEVVDVLSAAAQRIGWCIVECGADERDLFWLLLAGHAQVTALDAIHEGLVDNAIEHFWLFAGGDGFVEGTPDSKPSDRMGSP